MRERVCLTCRTLFDKNEECRGKGHRTIDVRSQKGRALISDEVWGPDSRARAMTQATKAGAGGALAGGALDWCNGCSPLDACDVGSAGVESVIGGLLAFLAIVLAATVGVVLFFFVRALVRYVREKLRKPVATGALTAAPKPRNTAVAGAGVVRGGRQLATPWEPLGSERTYGYAMELHEKRVLGGGAMLRDARTAGFEVVLDDGRIVKVPEGRIRVLGSLAKVSADERKLEAFVGEVDPARADNPTVFPFDFARGVTIEEGDRVELLGTLGLSQEPGSTGYREAATLAPAGVPFLRVQKSTGVRVAVAPPVVGASTAEAGIEEVEESPESLARRASPSQERD